nr:MAG TPA: hypothetical protein [Caudoviricetes sp.]
MLYQALQRYAFALKRQICFITYIRSYTIKVYT